MLIYLMRHGIAMRQGAYADADRPLTPEGEAQAEAVARAFERLDVQPQIVLASPAKRCWRTAAIVAEHLGLDDAAVRVAEPLAIGGSPANVLAAIAALGEVSELLLVGHQPGLESLASILLAGSNEVAIHLRRAGCACLEVESVPPKRPAVLHWLMTSHQLRDIGARLKRGRDRD